MIHRKNSDFAAFIGSPVAAKSRLEYDDPDATRQRPRWAARLPYLFACNRFRPLSEVAWCANKVGSYKSRDANGALAQQVDPQLRGMAIRVNSTETIKAQRPACRRRGRRRGGSRAPPGYYSSKFFLKPHYQLEGLTVFASGWSRSCRPKKGDGLLVDLRPLSLIHRPPPAPLSGRHTI